MIIRRIRRIAAILVEFTVKRLRAIMLRLISARRSLVGASIYTVVHLVGRLVPSRAFAVRTRFRLWDKFGTVASRGCNSAARSLRVPRLSFGRWIVRGSRASRYGRIRKSHACVRERAQNLRDAGCPFRALRDRPSIAQRRPRSEILLDLLPIDRNLTAAIDSIWYSSKHVPALDTRLVCASCVFFMIILRLSARVHSLICNSLN